MLKIQGGCHENGAGRKKRKGLDQGKLKLQNMQVIMLSLPKTRKDALKPMIFIVIVIIAGVALFGGLSKVHCMELEK